jgi:hypothetical protein
MEQTESVMSKLTARRLNQCRDIVKEINNFGINEFMILQIINLLALELEDREALIEICDVIKKHLPTEDQTKDLIL